MKTTPIFNWPVAEDTDPVKQYPTQVDDPFKSALDTKLSQAHSGVVLGGTYAGAPPDMTDFTVPLTTVKRSWGASLGSLVSNEFQITKAGTYRFSAVLQFVVTADAYTMSPAINIWTLTANTKVSLRGWRQLSVQRHATIVYSSTAGGDVFYQGDFGGLAGTITSVVGELTVESLTLA